MKIYLINIQQTTTSNGDKYMALNGAGAKISNNNK
jgi:hypothetical protein